MVIQFYDRGEELKLLDSFLSRNGFDLIIIYGRRRVGKTTLILKATENKKRLYYMAIEKNNLKGFFEKAKQIDPDITRLREDWEILFEHIKNHLDVVIIDEFQNMIKEDKGLLSTFQRIVDSVLQDSDLKLVLLGSTISLITSKVLSYKSPLYGRKSLSLRLKPIKFIHLREFFPEKSIHEMVEIYGFADGIPLYLIRIDRNMDFWKWLQKEFMEKSFIIDEVDFLMRYEFEDVSTYKAILQAIAFGKTRIKEIKDFTGMKRTDISPYLRNLIETGFVRRELPVMEKPLSKKGRYYINDNFLTFWFRFVYPNISAIEEGIFSVDAIRQEYTTYLGHVFEKICRELVVELIKQKQIPHFSKIGREWGVYGKNRKAYEIDIVALNDSSREILLAECKWQEKINPEKICRELVEKAEYVDWNKNEREEYLAVFARSFSKKIDEFEGRKVYCFDLENLEKILKI